MASYLWVSIDGTRQWCPLAQFNLSQAKNCRAESIFEEWRRPRILAAQQFRIVRHTMGMAEKVATCPTALASPTPKWNMDNGRKKSWSLSFDTLSTNIHSFLLLFDESVQQWRQSIWHAWRMKWWKNAEKCPITTKCIAHTFSSLHKVLMQLCVLLRSDRLKTCNEKCATMLIKRSIWHRPMKCIGCSALDGSLLCTIMSHRSMQWVIFDTNESHAFHVQARLAWMDRQAVVHHVPIMRFRYSCGMTSGSIRGNCPDKCRHKYITGIFRFRNVWATSENYHQSQVFRLWSIIIILNINVNDRISIAAVLYVLQFSLR